MTAGAAPGQSLCRVPPQPALRLWTLTRASEHPRTATAAKRGAGQLHLSPAPLWVMLTRLLDTGNKLQLWRETGKMPLWGGWTTAEGFGGQAAPSYTGLCGGHQLSPGVPSASPSGPHTRAVTCVGCSTEIPFVQYSHQCSASRQPAAGVPLAAKSAS